MFLFDGVWGTFAANILICTHVFCPHVQCFILFPSPLERSVLTCDTPTTHLIFRWLPSATRGIQTDMHQYLELPVQVMAQRKISVL
jgi:hypothetical protein